MEYVDNLICCEVIRRWPKKKKKLTEDLAGKIS